VGIIEEWRELIGPTNVEEAKEKAPESLRAQYGTKEMFNALHGSDSHEASIRLACQFFSSHEASLRLTFNYFFLLYNISK